MGTTRLTFVICLIKKAVSVLWSEHLALAIQSICQLSIAKFRYQRGEM